MTRKLSLVFVLLGLVAPKLAQPTLADLSWPEARRWIDRLGVTLADAVGADDIGSHDDAIHGSGTSAAGSDSWLSSLAGSSLQANGRPQDASRVNFAARANDRLNASDADSSHAPLDPSGARGAAATTLLASTFASADAIAGAPEAGELLALDAAGAGLSGADAFGAESFAACATGTVKGFGFDATTLEYETTCGNYNWSAESGGVDGSGVGSYATPTTPGGNSEYLTCLAPGVGQSDAGVVFNTETDLTSVLVADETSTTLVLEQPSAGWIVNQWRDRLVRVTSGPAANDVRRIASNDADTLILTTDRPFTNAPGGGTYTIRDDLGSVCWAAGERVKLNFMADAMLAQDHTVPGGKVLFPNFPGYDHGIYVDHGCGRKGAGSTAVSNGCPVLAPPNEDHRQRTIEAYRRIRWAGIGSDPNLFDAVDGRTGTWFIDDRGSLPDRTNIGYDPNDGTTAIAPHGFKAGVGGYRRASATRPRTGTPPATRVRARIRRSATARGAGRSTSRTRRTWQATIRTSASRTRCLSSGTCRGDRRIACTDRERTSSTNGGCDFGGEGTTSDPARASQMRSSTRSLRSRTSRRS